MNDKDIRNLFAQLKSDDAFVAVENAQLSTRLSSELGFAVDVAPARYGLRDYLEYGMWQFSHAMLRPMAASVAVFLFAITGWVSVMNASAHVLPGERLYPVKVAMEQAQMALAFSPERTKKNPIIEATMPAEAIPKGKVIPKNPRPALPARAMEARRHPT